MPHCRAALGAANLCPLDTIKKSMPPPNGPFIFVSYSSKDSHFVHPEIARLERQGYTVWYDKGELQPGLIWDQEIYQAIRACACFIVFISEAAVNSAHVLDEMDKALEVRKPFISVYWEKVNLPARFQEKVRRIQALERYALRRDEYEEPLEKALFEYVKKTFRQRHTRPDSLPKIVFFALLLSCVLFLFLAFVAIVTPYFSSPLPGDPLNNRLAGLLASLFFAVVAVGLCAAALLIRRTYLRRKNVRP
jgi:hypothetical protein